MDKKEYTDYLKQRDEETRAERVARWSKLEPAMYGKELPSIVWDYLNIVVDLYINAYFPAAIIFCAAILEAALRQRLSLTLEETEAFSLAQTAILSKALNILTEEDKRMVDEIRQYRNALMHFDDRKMAQLGKRLYRAYYRGWSDKDLEDLGSYMALMLLNLGDIGDKTFQYVKFTKDLMVKFYGEREG